MRTFNLLSLCFVATVALCGRCAEAEESGRKIEVTFTERDPKSSRSAVLKHLGFIPSSNPSSWVKQKDYDITKEVFRVYLPGGHDPSVPYGVVYFRMPYSYVDRHWAPVCDSRRLILIAPKDPASSWGNSIGLALDAVHNLKKRYTIDDDRIYTVQRQVAHQVSTRAQATRTPRLHGFGHYAIASRYAGPG